MLLAAAALRQKQDENKCTDIAERPCQAKAVNGKTASDRLVWAVAVSSGNHVSTKNKHKSTKKKQ